MKRLSTIIMALALVLGMSQCKKQEIPTNGNGGEKVYVTLNVNNGESIAVNVDNGGRHAVAPNLGVIQFRNDDVLYVGHDGKYIGKLTYNNGAFSGKLEPPTGNDFLHFYFLGGKAPEDSITAGTTTDFTINIADQSQNLPVLCYGASTQEYTATATNYSAVLEYKCALVRFNLEKQVYMNVNLSNVLTEATIDFVNHAITPITTSTGTMTLYGEEGVITHRWGILLPGTTLTGNSDLVWQGTGSMPTIVANGYVDAGVGAGILIHNPSIPAPSLTDAVHSGNNLSVFSVSPTQKVYFSKANLKRTPNSNTWEFHNSQVEECYGQPVFQQITNKLKSIQQSNYGYGPLINIYQSSMDRFCWGYYTQPSGPFMDVSSTDYVTGRKDLSRTLETDWGCAFPNTYWRTPTGSEWDYLLNNTARGNKRFMLVKFFNSQPVEGVQCEGLLLFPDDFVEPSNLTTTSGTTTLFSSTWYNQTDQYHMIDKLTYNSSLDGVCTQSTSNMYKLLEAGAVFLPAVGVRSGSGGYYYKYNYYVNWTNNNNMHGQGYYWSASFNGTDRSAQYLWFGIHGSQYQGDSSQPTVTEYVGVNNPNLSRDQGCCVRLVWDAN
ncbi:MAG: hypothetical protein IKQ09_01315 [Bacteroidales bacterium]|nr:hypothetical protein [Bacteroidales bacterium]